MWLFQCAVLRKVQLMAVLHSRCLGENTLPDDQEEVLSVGWMVKPARLRAAGGLNEGDTNYHQF
jgi:hypothetical protein